MFWDVSSIVYWKNLGSGCRVRLHYSVRPKVRLNLMDFPPTAARSAAREQQLKNPDEIGVLVFFVDRSTYCPGGPPS